MNNLSNITISVLGSTGSVGRQALDVAKKHNIRVYGITASTSVDLVEQQIREFTPAVCAMLDESAAKELKNRVSDTDCTVISGVDGICSIASDDANDIVINSNGHKEILFEKYGKKISIDSLSSGEKQIIYRGAFLLKDANSLSGSMVFIDEPEISLHPVWQMKVMEFYKGIFTNDEGIQTSQLFAVTHSPFVIHNNNRRNDKIIILARDENGNIVVKDKPEYYKCDSVEAVEDAFYIKSFSAEQPTVYLEGRTDEKYFKRAVQVYGVSVPFKCTPSGS